MWEISVLSVQFFCTFQTDLKQSTHKKKKKVDHLARQRNVCGGGSLHTPPANSSKWAWTVSWDVGYKLLTTNRIWSHVAPAPKKSNRGCWAWHWMKSNQTSFQKTRMFLLTQKREGSQPYYLLCRFKGIDACCVMWILLNHTEFSPGNCEEVGVGVGVGNHSKVRLIAFVKDSHQIWGRFHGPGGQFG